MYGKPYYFKMNEVVKLCFVFQDGCTPLAIAAENGAKNIVKLLLEKGVDPDLKGSVSNCFNQ